jgi:two-component system sensor histidine kinase ResE
MEVNFQKIINSISDGIMTIDKKGKVIQANLAFLKIFKQNNKNISGLSINSIPKLKHLKINVNSLNKLVKEKLKMKIEIDGEGLKIYQISIFPIRLKNKIEGAVFLVEDITRQEYLSEAQKKLSNIISQKLQIPSNIIKDYLNISLSGKFRELPQEAQNFLASAYQGNKRLVKTVNNILDMIDLESNEIFIKKDRSVNVDKLIKKVILDFDAQAKSKGLKLIYKKTEKKLPFLNVSTSEITKVLKHLLDNAIKFTNKGSITIFTEKISNNIIVNVQDTGKGISKNDQKFLFQKFLRLNKPQDNKDEIGLGLYICHTIIEKHGGEIWVKSKLGKGSNFSFSLPYKKH